MRFPLFFLLIAPAYPLRFDIEANELGVHSVSTTLFDLSNRTALVTGGSKGLGKAMARALAKAGASVAISSRHEDELKIRCRRNWPRNTRQSCAARGRPDTSRGG